MVDSTGDDGRSAKTGQGKDGDGATPHTSAQDAATGEVGFDAVQAARELDEALAAAAGDDTASTEAYVQSLESDIDTLSTELAQKEALVKKAEERADRANDEIERVQKRSAAEAGREVERRLRKVFCAMLETVDDLDRAISSARQMDHNPAVLDGVELVRAGCLKKLGDFGIHHFDSKGATFDPERHEAVTLLTVDDAEQDGQVLQVIQEGYQFGDEVLRPARVAVGRVKK